MASLNYSSLNFIAVAQSVRVRRTPIVLATNDRVQYFLNQSKDILQYYQINNFIFDNLLILLKEKTVLISP